MDRFDHIVMDREGYGEYVRYCDDFLVFADTRSELWALRARVASWRGHALHASNGLFADRVILEEGCGEVLGLAV